MSIERLIEGAEVNLKIDLVLLFVTTMFCSFVGFFILTYFGILPWKSLMVTWVLATTWGLVSYASYFILTLIYWLPDLGNESSTVYHPKVDAVVRYITWEGHPLIRGLPNVFYPILLFVLFICWFINWVIESDVDAAVRRLEADAKRKFPPARY
mgnify:FL=1